MGRGSTQILIKGIIKSLSEGPKSITEITEETGLDRTAIAKYLNLFKESGFLKEEKKGTNRIFQLSSTYRADTYFGLPIDEKTNKLIDSLYYLIEKKWKEKKGRKPLKTAAQKIIYDVIQKTGLRIPNGWYLYGGVAIKPYNYASNYAFTGLDKNILEATNNSIEVYSPYNFAYEIKQQQYKNAKKELYNIKEDIFRLLFSRNFSRKSMFIFQKKYIRIMMLLPKGDRTYDELVNDYMNLLIDITEKWDKFVNEKDDQDFANFKQKLISSFEALWRLIALFNFKKDLFVGGFYPKIELDEHFKMEIIEAKEELIEIGSELNEMIPPEEPESPTYKNIKESLKKVKVRDSEDQERIKKEMREYKNKYGLKALNEKLKKEFGLK